MSKEEYNNAIQMLKSNNYYLVGLALLSQHVSLEYIVSLIIGTNSTEAGKDITFGDYKVSTILN